MWCMRHEDQADRDGATLDVLLPDMPTAMRVAVDSTQGAAAAAMPSVVKLQGVSSPGMPVDFGVRIVAWQRRHGRHGLPWQGTRDAYRIWLSEIMLQQTQVPTVLRYYGAFLQRFPNVESLAAASQDEVMAAWSGLGYYSRARNLHRCAQAVVRDHGGVFPRTAAQLQALPGIGRSTAAAVAAFSAGERVAILDGNVKRVLGRVLAFDEDLAKPAAVDRLWDMAQALLPDHGIEAYTQGLMDLGATVCSRSRPHCGTCPVQDSCGAHLKGEPQAYPVKSRRVRRSERRSVVAIWRRPGPAGAPDAVLLCRRPDTGVWAGLWTLPLWPDEEAFGAALEVAAAGVDAPTMQALPPVVHALTHLDWTLAPLRASWPPALENDAEWLGALAATLPAAEVQAETLEWVSLDQALARGLPAPIRRLLADEG